ncbi:NAD(P)-dependent malic enzyme [Desertibaculum subflavum]|uniref:NAD(P)-dependent malic enzyme n=1 Tax=Desertibaculum subflavum TaxID=2268458 RepID=UPI000E67223A
MDQRDARIEQAQQPVAEAMRLHPLYRGKVQMAPKCPIRGIEDFAIWYTPGVAAPCRAIAANPGAVYEYTNKGNSIAIVSDGSRVLGLGDIGPAAGLPVMEGKALLFKYLGGVDAVPLCIDAKDPDEIVRTVRALAPSFGAINLEDIAQPKCFRVLDALRTGLDIPIWHDDQQGSATVALAGLKSALSIVGKSLGGIRIAMVGIGAANVAVYRLLKIAGVDPRAIIACDSKGVLHRGRDDIAQKQALFPDKWRVCLESNGDAVTGGIAEALAGADACIAFSRSGPGVIEPAWIATMARDAIVFACANPVPEIWPWEASAAGARIVATGRSDFPNQVNNSLVFPGMFRGVLDIRARLITDGMAIAAADELVRQAERIGVDESRILPGMDDWEVAAHVAAACGVAAQSEEVAGRTAGAAELYATARATIAEARHMTEVLMREGLIAPPGLGT